MNKKNIKKKINIKVDKGFFGMILFLVISIIGGTFAWFTYQSNESALVLSIGGINDSKVIIKPYQIKEILTPVNTYMSGVYSQVQVNNNSSDKMIVYLFYKVNKLDEILINNGLKYTIVSSTEKNGVYNEVLTGDFKSISENNEVVILNKVIDGNTDVYYKVYLWADSNMGDQLTIQNLDVNLELNGVVSLVS